MGKKNDPFNCRGVKGGVMVQRFEEVNEDMFKSVFMAAKTFGEVKSLAEIGRQGAEINYYIRMNKCDSYDLLGKKKEDKYLLSRQYMEYA